MEQVPLNLLPILTYNPNDFILHSGVSEVVSLSKNILLSEKPSVVLINGDRRSGKTHFSIWLADYAASVGLFPKLIDSSQLQTINFSSKEILILDDFDKILTSYQSTIGPGAIVSFFESAKHVGAKLFVLVNQLEQNLEPHVGSRLKSAIKVPISNPEENEIPEIFNSMARQRGIKLGFQKRKFAEKRLRRDIPSIERYLDRVMLLSHRMGRKLELGMLKSAVLYD